MKISETVGLIGVGNMGQAILEGLFKKKLLGPRQVWVYDKIKEKADAFEKRWGVHQGASVSGVIQKCGAVILAVKPQDLEMMRSEWKGAFRSSHILISILAGTPLAKIEKALNGMKPKMVRAMPNLGAKVGEAVTALAGSDAQALSLAEKVFSGCGRTLRLHENYFDLVTAVSGSGPAYFFFLMELLVEEGIGNGLAQEEARLLAVQTAVGAGLLAASQEASPRELREMVTSKGGTTEAAFKLLESQRVREIFHGALEAAIQRSRELSQG